MTNGKAFLGVLAGVAAGAALGLLFAPRNGSDTRKKISEKGEDLIKTLNGKIDEKFEELMSRIGGKGRKMTNHYADSAANKEESLSG